MKRRLTIFIALLVLAPFAVLAANVPREQPGSPETLLVTATGSSPSQGPVTAEIPESKAQINLSFAPLVKQVAPAVVNIYTERKIEQRLPPLFDDPFFRQFFGGNAPRGFARQRLENSLGSGVIIRGDGLIVTSNHVIEGADQIRVVLADRREFDAVVILADSHSDLAVLHVEAKGAKLPYIELKDSDTAEIGDLVLAIGDPFGVGQTVTSGIISAISHGSAGSGDLDTFIQTDAAINPGNSGGALVTMDGRLVGINTSIYSKSGGSLGIGFAVPSNIVRILLNAVEGGKKSVVRAWLGLEAQDITPVLAASLNMAQPSGVLINRIVPNSPAAKAGLLVGDVITQLDDKTIDDLSSFHYRIDTRSVGTKIRIVFSRKGQKNDTTLDLVAPPEIPPRDRTLISGRNPFGGATVENISPAVTEELGLHNVDQGVVVVDVAEPSLASNVGLKTGDLLVSVNGEKLTSVADVEAIAKEAATRWRLSVQRGDEVITVMVGG